MASNTAPSTSTLISVSLAYFRSHLFLNLPVPTKSFHGQTIIITGANTGLGLEAARHFVRLNTTRLILAVRNLEKGHAAAKAIATTTITTATSSSSSSPTKIEVWELDLASYDSVQTFAARATATLDRLDVVVANAGVLTHTFERVEDNERTITVNFISTVLLGVLLLPKLRATAIDGRAGRRDVVLTFTGSLVHWLARFEERKSDKILEACADEKKSNMMDRYNTSKLLLLFAVRELAGAVSHSSAPGSDRVIVSILNPGTVRTDLGDTRSAGGHDVHGLAWKVYVWLVGRKTEEGSRTLVHAAGAGSETHGEYLDDCRIGRVSDFVQIAEGVELQKRVWRELLEEMERIQPGISQII